MKKSVLFTLLIVGLLSSCSVTPEAIHFGEDQCAFCKMTIVDKLHAAQYVTKKGKQYKFDAVECMVNKINRESVLPELAILRVADYGDDGKMVNALTATYLISPAIKSPMGANLSAFADKKKAEEAQAKNGGDLYTWKQLLNHMAKR